MVKEITLNRKLTQYTTIVRTKKHNWKIVLKFLNQKGQSKSTTLSNKDYTPNVTCLGKVEMKETVIKATARATMVLPSLMEADPPLSEDVAGVAGDFPAGAVGVVVDEALLVKMDASGEVGEIPRSSVNISNNST